MAKTKISEYDAISANNTDVDSINIAEGCAPSGINNAIREVMAHLKDFQTGASGDSLTVGGNLSVTGTVTIPDNAISGDKVEGGTINAITINTLTAGQANFADNAKAIFGAGSDLQIYHDGTTSKIDGAVTLTSNVTLGDASTDTVTVNGYMGVGGGAVSYAGAYIQSNALTGTGQSGLYSYPTATSAATSTINSIQARIGTAAASFTVADATSLLVADAIKGAGSTITNQHGVRIADQTQGTNNYGITSLVSSGTNKWNIYASGTAANYFAGDVQLYGKNLYFRGTAQSGINTNDNAGNYDISGSFTAGRYGFNVGTGYHFLSTAPYGAQGTAITYTERMRVGLTEAVFNEPGNDYDFRIESDTNSHAFFLEGSTGNVGIGTSSPTLITAGSRVLEVSGAGDYFPSINLARTGATGYTNVNWKQFLSSNGGLYFRQNSTDRLVIDSAGNLGLGVTPSFGTTSGVAAFQVKNASLYGYLNASYQAANLYLDAGTTKFIASAPASYYYQNSGAHSWHISTNATPTAGAAISFTQAMTLDASGRLGIGTTSPSYKTDIQGASTILLNVQGEPTAGSAETVIRMSQQATLISANNEIRSGVTSGQNPYLSFAVRESNSPFATVERVRITTAGDFLVGTTAVSTSNLNGTAIRTFAGGSYVEIAHNTSATSGNDYASFRYNGTQIGGITQNGTTAVAYNTSSDYRLKEDWQPMTGASERVKALKPVNFAWKADGSRVDGFLAHEAQAVVPEAVTGTKDAVDADGNPEYQGIDQSKLVPLLTAALQEALAKIESLEARLDAANL